MSPGQPERVLVCGGRGYDEPLVVNRVLEALQPRWMLEFGRPDLVVAFPGGRGTEDMVTKAERAGIRVLRVEDDG